MHEVMLTLTLQVAEIMHEVIERNLTKKKSDGVFNDITASMSTAMTVNSDAVLPWVLLGASSLLVTMACSSKFRRAISVLTSE